MFSQSVVTKLFLILQTWSLQLLASGLGSTLWSQHRETPAATSPEPAQWVCVCARGCVCVCLAVAAGESALHSGPVLTRSRALRSGDHVLILTLRGAPGCAL